MPPPRRFRWPVPPTVVGLSWIVCIGVLDWLTGAELSLSAFYLPGVALVAWFAGRGAAALMACCAAIAWLLAELAFNLSYSNPLIPYWNCGIRLTFFLITAFLIVEVRTRQRTEAALREHDSILSSILDSMRDGVIVVGVDGVILTFNPAARELLGSQATGRNAREWAAEVDASLIECVSTGPACTGLLSLAVAGVATGYHEISLRRASDGSSRLLGLTILPLMEGSDQTAGVVIVIADLTSKKSLERRIAEASEHEQRRIGQDLHDGVCQHLVGVAFAAGTLQDTLESIVRPKEAAAAGEIATLINDAITEARNLAHGLYPASLSEGIEVALTTLASATQEHTGISCSAVCNDVPPHLDPVCSTHLYRITQECISNACRHAAPRSIGISLENLAGILKLVVEDDGRGIDTAHGNTGGIGFNLMRHRASLMGGNLEVDSRAGHGTKVTCTLPHLERQT